MNSLKTGRKAKCGICYHWSIYNFDYSRFGLSASQCPAILLQSHHRSQQTQHHVGEKNCTEVWSMIFKWFNFHKIQWWSVASVWTSIFCIKNPEVFWTNFNLHGYLECFCAETTLCCLGSREGLEMFPEYRVEFGDSSILFGASLTLS